MKNFFNKKAQPPIKSLIAQGSQINGHIRFTDGLRVDGDVFGDIRADEASNTLLVISECATITGEVRADHVIVNGLVVGPVHARDLLELQPKARIEGDVYYKAIEMHQGAVISGQLRPLPAIDMDEKPTLKLATKNP